MAYRQQLYISPATLTDLTVIVKYENVDFPIRIATLDDFNVVGNELNIVFALASDCTITIYSQGYEVKTLNITIEDLEPKHIVLTPTFDYIKTSDGTNDYYVKDSYSRQFGNDLLDIVMTKADSSDIPTAVTESTVSGWGFTKNTGTVISVNNIEPINGNVTISIPDTSNFANKDLSNLSTTGNTKFQAPLVSGTSIKTINNTSLLGSGNIDTEEVFVSTFGTTTYDEVTNALNEGKVVFCKYTDSVLGSVLVPYTGTNASSHLFIYTRITDYNIIRLNEANNSWVESTTTIGTVTSVNNAQPVNGNVTINLNNKADTDLSNLSSTGNLIINGAVTSYNTEILSGVSLNGSTDLEYTLNGLPDDNYTYMVLFSGAISTGSASGNYVRIGLYSDACPVFISLCSARTRSSSNQNGSGNCWMPVPPNRKIYIARSSSWNGTATLETKLYYRLGNGITI